MGNPAPCPLRCACRSTTKARNVRRQFTDRVTRNHGNARNAAPHEPSATPGHRGRDHTREQSIAMNSRGKALLSQYDNVFLLDGVRTPFVDYNTALGLISPTDLGIKAARAIFERARVPSADVDIVVAGNMAQASF